MELLRVSDVQRETKLSRSTIYALCQQGKLPVVRFGKAIRFPREALEEYLRRKTEMPE
ncbi:MAG: helix-turn-helix domain-containing protein [Chloroflexi bacterium]|nr:helix-turn-helix domain-containing protein [Chloroflexota bacterium]